MRSRDGCCATWPKPCQYHEGWQDAIDVLEVLHAHPGCIHSHGGGADTHEHDEPDSGGVSKPRGDEDGTLMIHPGYQFGSVCCSSTRVPTYAVVGCVRGGDSVDATADDYALTRLQLLTACWWETRQVLDIAPSKRTKHQQQLAADWGDWEAEASMILGGHRRKDGVPPEKCPDPPESGNNE